MIGSIPLAGYEISKQIKAGELKNPLFKFGLGFAMAGVAIGAYYGAKEALRGNDYRVALAQDLRELHAKTDGKHMESSR